MNMQYNQEKSPISPSRSWGKYTKRQPCAPMYGRLYDYAGNNPVRYIDPDGRADEITIEWIYQNVSPQYQAAALEFLEESKVVNRGTLTVKDVAGILFNETRSLSGDKIGQARNQIAHAIINADKKWGEQRNKYAKTAPIKANPPYSEYEIYNDCMNVAKEAVKEDAENIDPTNGAYFFNFRKTDSTIDFQGKKNHTSTGPLDNSYTDYKYANTYGD